MNSLDCNLFMKIIYYLGSTHAKSLCQVNRKFHNFATSSRYRIPWKVLIENKYKEYAKFYLNNYQENNNVFNYLTYITLTNKVDKITKYMISYKTGEGKWWFVESKSKKEKTQKFLALFLLGKVEHMYNYIPSEPYKPFIDYINGCSIEQNILNKMMIEMSINGNIYGIQYLVEKGTNIHADDDWAHWLL